MSAEMPASPPPISAGAVPGRYAYLVGRLRTRQITMEEATELFGLMQGMLRDAQVVRAKIERAQRPPPMPAGTTPTTVAPPVALSEDMLLLGLLALGAGAGLGAAFVRRMSGDAPSRKTPPPPAVH